MTAVTLYKRFTKVFKLALLPVVFAAACVAFAQDSAVSVYPAPYVRTTSSQFAVTVTPVNGGVAGSQQAVPTFQFGTSNDAVGYSFAQFSFSGTVQITVTDLLDGSVTTHSISPLAFDLENTVTLPSSRSISFTLTQSRYLVVKINSLAELIIAADPAEVNPPSPSGAGVQNITASPYNVIASTRVADPSATSPDDTTTQIQDAINNAHNYNNGAGGTVYVPAGVYLINHLVLHSNVNLYLAGGAVLQDSGEQCEALYATDASVTAGQCHATGAAKTSDFQKKVDQTAQTPSAPAYLGKWLVSTAPGTTNISITGRGMIDGNGTYMRDTAKYLNALIMPLRTQNFTLDGVVGWSAAFWALTPTRSSNVSVTNYKALQDLGPSICGLGSPACMQEDDAIDINESNNVLVQHALAVSRDDNYSTKTWGGAALSDIGITWGGTSMNVTDVLFTDVVAWTLDDAFKIGNGAYLPQTGVTFDHGYVYRAGYAADVFPKGTSTAAVSDITFQNLDVEAAVNNWARLTNAPIAGQQVQPISEVAFENINIRKTKNIHYASSDASGPVPTQVTWANIVNSGARIRTTTDLFNSATTTIKNNAIIPYITAAPIAATAADTLTGVTPAFTQDPLALLDNMSANGGQTGDSLTFAGIDLGAGASSATLRVATADTGGVVSLSLVSSTAAPIGSDTFNTSTGGWQSWRSDAVSLTGPPSGVKDVYLDFTAPGTHTAANVDWVRFNLAQTIQAESFASGNSGATTGSCADPDDQTCAKVTLIQGGSIEFPNLTFPSGISTVYLRMAAQFSGTVSLYLDDPSSVAVGSAPVAITIDPAAPAGSGGTWQTVPVAVSGLTGTHTLYIIASGRTDNMPILNLNWFAY